MSSYKGPRATAKASASTSCTSTQETKKNSGNDPPNADGKSKASSSTRQADLSKYAKYLQEDKVKFDEASYKPTIHADRQTGVSASLNQRRNRLNGEPVTGANEDPGQRRRPAQRAHIRAYSLNRTAANKDGSSRLSSFQKGTDIPGDERPRSYYGEDLFQRGTDVPRTERPQSYYGEDLFTRSRISKTDVLHEEQASPEAKPGLSSGPSLTKETSVEDKDTSKPTSRKTSERSSAKERFFSSSSNPDNKDSSKTFASRIAAAGGGTSTRASRSGRTATDEDAADKLRSQSKSKTEDFAPTAASKKTESSQGATAKEPGRKFFSTIDDLYTRKTSGDTGEQSSSTPKSKTAAPDASEAESPHGRSAPRKTFLSPEAGWNSKYFPSPYETSDNRTSQSSNVFDSSSCRNSPIRQDREETEKGEFQYSPKSSAARNGLHEHLKTQESRRSHSLDSRGRTPTRESSGNSPSPRSGKTRRSRIDQMDSLNESKFENKSAFKEHLLNLTMNKDEYEDIMSDFKNGSIVEEPDVMSPEVEHNIPEIIINGTNDNQNEDATLKSQNNPQEADNGLKNTPNEPGEAGSSNTPIDVTDKKETGSDTTDSGIKTTTVKDNNKDTKQEPESSSNGQSESEKESKENYFRLLEELIKAARAKYSSPDQCKNSESQVILEPILSEQLTHKWRFQKTEFGIPTSMGVTSDGFVVVADYGNSCLEYFSESGDFEHKIDGVKPFGIAVNRKDHIIVGDRRGKAIRIFDKFGADVSQWESKTFGWISGIALLKNGHLVICDRDRCKVGIYTEGGENVTEFGSYGTNNSQLCMADFLAVDSKDRIVVADSGNHCLKLFDTSGKAIGKISSRGIEDGLLEWPKGICIDKNDNIIVADMHNNRVSMFSNTGGFLQQLLSTTPNPYNVCYGQDANILGTLHYSLKGFSQYDIYAF